MLYDISMFWDGRYSSVKATADSAEDAAWVKVTANDAATTTIFVRNRQNAEKLADLINELNATAELQTAA